MRRVRRDPGSWLVQLEDERFSEFQQSDHRAAARVGSVSTCGGLYGEEKVTNIWINALALPRHRQTVGGVTAAKTPTLGLDSRLHGHDGGGKLRRRKRTATHEGRSKSRRIDRDWVFSGARLRPCYNGSSVRRRGGFGRRLVGRGGFEHCWSEVMCGGRATRK